MAGDLTLRQVTEASVARSARWHPGGITDWSVQDWAVAMAGEAGEVCNAVKKLRRVEDGIANRNDPGRGLATREAAVAKIGEEAADVVLYLVLLCARVGLDPAAEVVRKFNATSALYGFPERLPPVEVGQVEAGPVAAAPACAPDLRDLVAHAARQRKMMADHFRASPAKSPERQAAQQRELDLQDALVALLQRQADAAAPARREAAE